MRWKLPTLAALAAVVVLAGGCAAIGLAAGGVPGVVTGAVTGALAGVAAGYVPVLGDRARQRQERLRALAASAEPGLPEQGPSLLLRPERGVVAFTGRTVELASLRAWCGSPDDLNPADAVHDLCTALGASWVARQWQGGTLGPGSDPCPPP
jgi:hypothetical protein